jgi:hypothetical protein
MPAPDPDDDNEDDDDNNDDIPAELVGDAAA